jgi:hypothetical protein
MIKAKADNMELVVFVKNDEWDLTESCNDALMFFAGKDYFLCLPQHNKDGQCLHWLNGGKIQYKTELVPEFQDYQPHVEFGLGSIFMQPDFEIRIKPRKEKRAIGVNAKTGQTTNAYKIDKEGNYAVDEVRLNYGISGNWQFIEIEVEI